MNQKAYFLDLLRDFNKLHSLNECIYSQELYIRVKLPGTFLNPEVVILSLSICTLEELARKERWKVTNCEEKIDQPCNGN